MQISTVKLKDVLNSNRCRLDASYWQSKYKVYDYQSNYILLQDILSNEDIDDIKSKLNVATFNYLEISGVSLSSLYYNTNEINFVDTPNRAKYILQENDICISTVRPRRNAVSYIRNIDHSQYLVGTNGFCVIRVDIKKISSEFMYILCKTKFFTNYLIRESTATMYPAVIDDDIYKFKIPKLSHNLQKLIANMVNVIYKMHSYAKCLYVNAQDIIEIELNIKNFKPKTQKFSAINIDMVKANNNRLNAKFYQPKYNDIINKITSYQGGFEKLSNIVDIKKSIEVGSNAYIEEEEVPYIRVSNLTAQGFVFSDSTKYITDNYYQELAESYQPQVNDILLTKDGTVGIAYKVNKNDNFKMILSGAILRLQNSTMNENVLAVILNSVLVQSQAEKYCGGALISHWLVDDIKNVLIPRITQNVQDKISELVENSFEIQHKAKALLELAKTAVETAIEHDEPTATDHINKELAKLNITL